MLENQIAEIREELSQILEMSSAAEVAAWNLIQRAVKLALFNTGHDASAACAADVLDGLRDRFPQAVRSGRILSGQGIDISCGYSAGEGFAPEQGAQAAFSRSRSGQIRHRKAVALTLQSLWREQSWDTLTVSQVKLARPVLQSVTDCKTLNREINALLKRVDKRPLRANSPVEEAALEAAIRLLQEASKAVS